MIKGLLASSNTTRHAEIIDAFQSVGINISPADSGEGAADKISQTPYELLITDDQLSDMTGRQLIEKIIALHPFLNCAVISDIDHKEFHERYEGLGVLMQIPPEPSNDDAQKLYEHIKKVSSLFVKSS